MLEDLHMCLFSFVDIWTDVYIFRNSRGLVKYLCPADVVPPYIEVDLSQFDVGQELLMCDLNVHRVLKLLQSPDKPYWNIIGPRAPEQKKSK